MNGLDEQRTALTAKFAAMLPDLEERQRRLLLGMKARSLEHGGIRAVARAAGVREGAVSLGMREPESGQGPLGRIRRVGGGRRRLVEREPVLRVSTGPECTAAASFPPPPGTQPDQPAELTRQGYRIGPDTVGGLLREEGFSLQGNAKVWEGAVEESSDQYGGGAAFAVLDPAERALVHLDLRSDLGEGEAGRLS